MDSKSIKILSLSRSGQHAFCNWLCLQVGECTFFNHDGHVNEDGSVTPNVTYQKPYSGQGHSYNTVTLNENFISAIDSDFTIILLRDPFNWIASLCASVRRSDAQMKTWATHYQTLTEMATRGDGDLLVKYNDWFASEEYRKIICDHMGLSFTDKGINQVPATGEGSSFDYQEYDGKAQEMKVLERWRHVIGDNSTNITSTEYRKIFDDYPFLKQIADEHFDMKIGV